MGVAFSSLILQNTLVAYLDMYVTGPEKEEIITRVRKSVRAIAEMDIAHQAQVIQAYEAALRWTFVSAIAFFIIVNVLIIPLKLPRLGYDRVAANTEDED